MKKFVLVDHSLKDLGGHYYTYASCVLPAAERAGYKAVLAIHREFSDFEALPRSWEAHAIFRRKSQSQRALDLNGASRPLQAWWTRVRNRWRARQSVRVATGFAADCATLFRRVRLEAGDHVFFATASELDLHGLAMYLHKARAHRGVHWHLQFHLGIFQGRDPDYATQSSSREAVRRVFRQALTYLPGHAVHFYCTTAQLTAQYQRLDVASFRTLPYPVHPLFRDGGERPANSPVRIACLGHSCREKGYRLLPAVVRGLWPDYLQTGRAQLLLQTRRRDLQRPLDAVVGELGGASEASPVAYAEFPLPLDQYAALVRSADIGLLLYDSTRYYARCSGVLLEMLCAGVPVVVPAGGWLSEQISEENQSYLEGLAQHTRAIHVALADDLSWESGAASDRVLTLGALPAVASMPVTPDAGCLMVSFRWREPYAPGTYLRIDLEQLDDAGGSVETGAAIEGPRAAERNIHVLFNLDPRARRIRLKWRNAWDTTRILLDRLECSLLAGGHRPAGSVGLAAADPEQCVQHAHDILQHVDHYRRGAAAFATRCAEHHNADQIVAMLVVAAKHDSAHEPAHEQAHAVGS